MAPEKIGIASAKLQVEQSAFYPIYKDFVLGARIRFGHIFRRDFDDIMPIERFYLGGPYSVRGYEIDSLPPLGVTEKNAEGEIIRQYTAYQIKDSPPPGVTREYAIQGGSSMANVNLELRVPIFKNFYGAVFQDLGALSQTGLGGFKMWFPTSGCRGHDIKLQSDQLDLILVGNGRSVCLATAAMDGTLYLVSRSSNRTLILTLPADF